MSPKTRQNLNQVLETIPQLEKQTKNKEYKRKIIAYLNDQTEPKKPTPIANALGLKAPTVRRNLAIMLNNGTVKRHPKGSYTLNHIA